MRKDRVLVSFVAALVLAGAVFLVPSPTSAQPPPPGQPRFQVDPYAGYPDRTVRPAPGGDASILASGPTRALVADPDTIAPATGSQYVTYGTSVYDLGTCGASAPGNRYYVPYIVSGLDDAVNLDNECITGDAMPAGPGAWAEPNSPIWAPSVVYFGGRYILYYTASRQGSGQPGQKCIGKAGSASPTGPFSDSGEVACPDTGRWAIDPDAFVHNGALYMIYRDDAITAGPETGISVVRMTSTGAADWPTRKEVFESTDISWESIDATNHIIENPTMMNVGGNWMVFYSGNSWNTARYSTGIALCPSPLPPARCTPYASTTQPYFGYTGEPSGINPLYGLPRNERGPGGMSLFRNRAGDARVVWHFLEGATTVRRGMVGVLSFNGLVWAVS